MHASCQGSWTPSATEVMMPEPVSASCFVAKRGFRSQDKKKRQIECPNIGSGISHHIHNHMVWRRIRSLLLQKGKFQISLAPRLRLLTAVSHYLWSFWREPEPEKYYIISWANDTCSLWQDSWTDGPVIFSAQGYF